MNLTTHAGSFFSLKFIQYIQNRRVSFTFWILVDEGCAKYPGFGCLWDTISYTLIIVTMPLKNGAAVGRQTSVVTRGLSKRHTPHILLGKMSSQRIVYKNQSSGLAYSPHYTGSCPNHIPQHILIQN